MFCDDRVFSECRPMKEGMQLTDDGTRHLEIDELEKSRGVSVRLYEASLVDGRVGHCRDGREEGLLCTGLEGRRGLGRGIIYGWDGWSVSRLTGVVR